jgi:hypothetical protein
MMEHLETITKSEYDGECARHSTSERFTVRKGISYSSMFGYIVKKLL